MFWRKKKMFILPMNMSAREIQEQIQANADRERADKLLAEEKAKKAQKERFNQLEADLIELLGLQDKPSTTPKGDDFFGINRWLLPYKPIRQRLIDLIKEQQPLAKKKAKR